MDSEDISLCDFSFPTFTRTLYFLFNTICTYLSAPTSQTTACGNGVPDPSSTSFGSKRTESSPACTA